MSSPWGPRCSFYTLLWQSPPEVGPTSGTSSVETGNAASTGQSGGVTAGFYINQAPPVTDQQRAEALAGLKAQIGKLFELSNRQDPTPPRTSARD